MGNGVGEGVAGVREMPAQRTDRGDRMLRLSQYSCLAPIVPLPRYPATPQVPLPSYPMLYSTPITPLSHYPFTPKDSLCESS
mgnify:CR=1 FL=1